MGRPRRRQLHPPDGPRGERRDRAPHGEYRAPHEGVRGRAHLPCGDGGRRPPEPRHRSRGGTRRDEWQRRRRRRRGPARACKPSATPSTADGGGGRGDRRTPTSRLTAAGGRGGPAAAAAAAARAPRRRRGAGRRPSARRPHPRPTPPRRQRGGRRRRCQARGRPATRGARRVPTTGRRRPARRRGPAADGRPRRRPVASVAAAAQKWGPPPRGAPAPPAPSPPPCCAVHGRPHDVGGRRAGGRRGPVEGRRAAPGGDGDEQAGARLWGPTGGVAGRPHWGKGTRRGLPGIPAPPGHPERRRMGEDAGTEGEQRARRCGGTILRSIQDLGHRTPRCAQGLQHEKGRAPINKLSSERDTAPDHADAHPAMYVLGTPSHSQMHHVPPLHSTGNISQQHFQRMDSPSDPPPLFAPLLAARTYHLAHANGHTALRTGQARPPLLKQRTRATPQAAGTGKRAHGGRRQPPTARGCRCTPPPYPPSPGSGPTGPPQSGCGRAPPRAPT